MKMSLEQTQLVGLTMKMELKAKEYKRLCEELEELKRAGVDPNSPELEHLLEEFMQNNKEIAEINEQLRKLQKNS